MVLSGIGGAAFSCILVPASSVSLDRYLRDRYLTIGDDGTLVLLSMVFLISACMAEALFVQVGASAIARRIFFFEKVGCAVMARSCR